jgi:hypothetical protein
MVEYIFSQSIVISIPDYTEKNKLKYPDFEVGEGFDKMNTSKNTKNVKFIVKDLHPFEFVAQFLSIHNKNKNEKRIIFDLNSNLFKINKKKSEIKDIDGLEIVLNDVYGVTHTVSLKSGDTDTFKALNDELENKVFKLEDIDLDLNKFENSDKDIRAKHNKHSALRLQWVIDTDYLKDVEKEEVVEDEEDKKDEEDKEEVVETVDEVKRANEILGKLEHFTENEENEAINSAIKDVKEGVKEVEALIGEEDGSITGTGGATTSATGNDNATGNNPEANDEPIVVPGDNDNEANDEPIVVPGDNPIEAENATNGKPDGNNPTEAVSVGNTPEDNATNGKPDGNNPDNASNGKPDGNNPDNASNGSNGKPDGNNPDNATSNDNNSKDEVVENTEPEPEVKAEQETNANTEPEDKLKDAKAKLSKLIATLLDILNKSKSRFIEEAKNLLKNEKTPNKKKIEDILPLLDKEDENTDELLNLISEIYTKENKVGEEGKDEEGVVEEKDGEEKDGEKKDGEEDGEGEGAEEGAKEGTEEGTEKEEVEAKVTEKDKAVVVATAKDKAVVVATAKDKAVEGKEEVVVATAKDKAVVVATAKDKAVEGKDEGVAPAEGDGEEEGEEGDKEEKGEEGVEKQRVTGTGVPEGERVEVTGEEEETKGQEEETEGQEEELEENEKAEYVEKPCDEIIKEYKITKKSKLNRILASVHPDNCSSFKDPKAKKYCLTENTEKFKNIKTCQDNINKIINPDKQLELDSKNKLEIELPPVQDNQLELNSKNKFEIEPPPEDNNQLAIEPPPEDNNQLAIVPPPEDNNQLAIVPPPEDNNQLAIVGPSSPEDNNQLAIVPPPEDNNQLAIVGPSSPEKENNLLAIEDKKNTQGGGSSSSPQNLMNELNYEVHISLFIQKIMKMLIFRYLVHIKQELTYKEYLFEAFVNMVVFCVLNTGNDISFTCYILDQMITYIVLLLYLKFVDKEGLDINENYVSAIILVPYYLVLF